MWQNRKRGLKQVEEKRDGEDKIEKTTKERKITGREWWDRQNITGKVIMSGWSKKKDKGNE